MDQNNAAAPAQDNTAPAAPASATNAVPAPAGAPAAPPASQANAPAPAQPAPSNNPDTTGDPAAPVDPKGDENNDLPAPAMEMLLGNGGDGGTDDGTADPALEGEIDGYELTFPDNMVADDEAVAVLNEVGKEFGVTGEAAQKLADAATAYANRRVDAVLEAGQKGYADFCADEAKKTKEYYGADYKTKLADATVGLNKLLPEGVTVDAIRKDPNFQALTNVWWFAEMGRKYNLLTSEQPSITGEPERAKASDLYSKYD